MTKLDILTYETASTIGPLCTQKSPPDPEVVDAKSNFLRQGKGHKLRGFTDPVAVENNKY